jgi:DNA-binding transcriptional regulator YdaS (Cro superfamily)
MTPLDRAIEALGGVGILASAIGVASSAPSMWKTRGRVPAEHCPAIERETRRIAKEKDDPSVVVTCEQLRDDVPWAVLREQIDDPAAVAKAA